MPFRQDTISPPRTFALVSTPIVKSTHYRLLGQTTRY